MNFYIKIISEGTKEEIIINGRTDADIQEELKYFNVMVDTVDENNNNRTSDILNRAEFKMSVSSKTNSICKQLMDWALSTDSSKIFRTVQVDVYDNTEFIRSFKMDNMFVEDYFEEYTKSGSEVVMKMIQKANNAKNFRQSNKRI